MLREFYYSHRHSKERVTANFLLAHTYDAMASEERRFIGDASISETSRRIVMCIGTAGICSGSRIKGHLRYRGKKLRKCHRKYATIAMTDEYKSSQTCSACFSQIVHPKRPVNVTKSVNGSSLCLNSECPTYKFGVNTRNRDVEAAKCIALAGMTAILYSQTLPPFSRLNNSQYQTVFRMPRVKSAQPVPVSTGVHAERT
jgi:hypothetical protein